jgi:hypothetical protein
MAEWRCSYTFTKSKLLLWMEMRFQLQDLAALPQEIYEYPFLDIV